MTIEDTRSPARAQHRTGAHEFIPFGPFSQNISTTDQPTAATPAQDTFWHGTVSEIETPWLVKGLLPEVSTTLLAGQWGLFKSFTLIDLAASVITGNPFAGHRVKRTGGVLVLAAEGANTFGSRIAGLVKEGRLPSDPQPFAWKSSFPSLLAPNAFTELEKMIVEIERQMLAKWNVPLVLIAVDTLAAAAGFTDENDNAQAQRAMNVLTQLAARFQCCAMGLDHFGKNVDSGTRGGSAKEAAADAVLALLGERVLSGEVTKYRLAVRKTRHGGEVGREIPFTPRTVVLGEDQDGDPVTTRVIDWLTTAGEKAAGGAPRRKWGKSQMTLRKALLVALAKKGRKVAPYGAEGPTVVAVDQDVVREEYDRLVVVNSKDVKSEADAKRKRFTRDLEASFVAELIGVRNKLVWLVLPDDVAAVEAASAWSGADAPPEAPLSPN
jgi:hypothetical protein